MEGCDGLMTIATSRGEASANLPKWSYNDVYVLATAPKHFQLRSFEAHASRGAQTPKDANGHIN